jgi:paraquat-inducible protein A
MAFETSLIACPQCDLLQREPACTAACVVRCSRCQALLYRAIPGALDATLALSIAAAALFAVGNLFPVLSLGLQSQEVSATLVGIARALYGEGMPGLAALLLLTLVVMPALQIAARLYMLLPLFAGRVPRGLAHAARALDTMRRWSMVEVFILAAVVCMHRLAQEGRLEVEPGFWAIGAVMMLFAVMDSLFDARDLWAHPAWRNA